VEVKSLSVRILLIGLAYKKINRIVYVYTVKYNGK